MRITESPLRLTDFLMLQSRYRFIEPKDGEVNAAKVFAEYEIDLDFNALEQPNGEVLLFVKVSVNDAENNLPGYALFAEGVGVFGLAQDHGLSEKVVSELVYVSGLGITINNVRNHLLQLTMNGPFGKYTLPSIDIGALHKAKKEVDADDSGK